MTPTFIQKARAALKLDQQAFGTTVCCYTGKYAYATVSKLENGVIEASSQVQKLIRMALKAKAIRIRE